MMKTILTTLKVLISVGIIFASPKKLHFASIYFRELPSFKYFAGFNLLSDTFARRNFCSSKKPRKILLFSQN